MILHQQGLGSMTQALINSLNILPEKSIDLANKMSKSSGMDFGKIFETKTGKIETKITKPETAQKNDIKTTDKKTVDNSPKQTTNNDNNVQNVCNKESDNTTQPTKTNTEDDNNNINTKLNGIIKKFTKDDSTDTEQTDTEETSEIITINEEDSESVTTDEESDYNDETIITDEEPTMYNELITLEDPTALLMLQSQIQKTITTGIQDEQTENTEDGFNNNQTLNSSKEAGTNTSTSVFKQLDAQIAKNANVVKNQPTDIPRSKTTDHKPSNVLNENIVKELNVEVISSQSAEAESSMGDLMQNQSPQEQTARIMIQGDIKYETVASETAKNVTQTKTTSITPGRIIEQISKQLENMVNNSKLNMVLNPGSLGKLNLQIINSKEGILAQFTVTTQEARDILMKGLNGLKESLLAQGVSVDNVSVKLENAESEYEADYTEQEENSKGGYKHQGAKKQKENSKNFEEMMFNLENEGNV